MILKNFLAVAMCLFFITCGSEPAGWDGVIISESGEISDTGLSGDDPPCDDPSTDDPPVVDPATYFFVVQEDSILNYYSSRIDTSALEWRLISYSHDGWCLNEDGTISSSILSFEMQLWFIFQNVMLGSQQGRFELGGGTMDSDRILSSTLEGYIITPGDTTALFDDYELRFAPDTSYAVMFINDSTSDWIDSGWGEIPNTGSCE